MKRNEVASKVSSDATEWARQNRAGRPFFADDDRQQRNALLLRDVDYVGKENGMADGEAVEAFLRRTAGRAVAGFPAFLALPEQGLFTLGYHQHLPSTGRQFYGKTRPGRCYATEAEARQDGCRRSKR